MSSEAVVDETAQGLRDRILAADDIQEEVLHVDAWGVDVLVRGMTGKARGDFLDKCFTDEGKPQFDRLYADLVILTTLDPDTHAPIFSMGDRDALNAKSGAALSAIANLAQRLSGMQDKAVDAAKGNSNGTPSDDSTSS